MIVVGGEDLPVHHVIRLPKKAASLAVTEDDVGDEHGAQHERADFPSEGTVGLVVHVLGPDADVVAVRQHGHGSAEADEGRGDDDIHVVAGLGEDEKVFEEVLRLGRSFVHFPVRGDDRFTHGWVGRDFGVSKRGFARVSIA